MAVVSAAGSAVAMETTSNRPGVPPLSLTSRFQQLREDKQTTVPENDEIRCSFSG